MDLGPALGQLVGQCVPCTVGLGEETPIRKPRLPNIRRRGVRRDPQQLDPRTWMHNIIARSEDEEPEAVVGLGMPCGVVPSPVKGADYR